MSRHRENVIWRRADGRYGRGFYTRIIPTSQVPDDFDWEWDVDHDYGSFDWARTGLPSQQAALDSWTGANPGGHLFIDAAVDPQAAARCDDMAAALHQRTAAAGVIVVACGAAKTDRPAPAAELYTGSLFRAARRAAEAAGRPWLICSAQHGLVHPGTRLVPYDRTVDGKDGVQRLARILAGQLRAAGGPGTLGSGVEAWAPARYVAALTAAGIDVRAAPLAGLGIGQQIAWLTAHARARTGTPAAAPRPAAPAAAAQKHHPTRRNTP